MIGKDTKVSIATELVADAIAVAPLPSRPAFTSSADGVVAPSGRIATHTVPASVIWVSTVKLKSSMPVARGKPSAFTGGVVSTSVVTVMDTGSPWLGVGSSSWATTYRAYSVDAVRPADTEVEEETPATTDTPVPATTAALPSPSVPPTTSSKLGARAADGTSTKMKPPGSLRVTAKLKLKSCTFVATSASTSGGVASGPVVNSRRVATAGMLANASMESCHKS